MKKKKFTAHKQNIANSVNQPKSKKGRKRRTTILKRTSP